VRNRGTIGGSLANNDPSACYPAAVLASGATVVTNGARSRGRLLPGHVHHRAGGGRDHHLGALSRSRRRRTTRSSLQPASRFALTGVFVAKFADGVRVAVTGASEEGVFRWTEAEAALGPIIMTIWRPSILGMFSTLPISSTSVGHPFEQFAAEVLVRHLAAAEAQRDLHLVAALEERKTLRIFTS
jgi:hypothetical protein